MPYRNIWSVQNDGAKKIILRIIPDLSLHLVFDLSGTMNVEPFLIYAGKTFIDFEILPDTHWVGLQFNVWQGSGLIKGQEDSSLTYYAQFDADWVNLIYFWLLDAKNNRINLSDSLKVLHKFSKFIDDSLNKDFERNFFELASHVKDAVDLEYSERHQRRLFQKLTLLSPNLFKRIVRFQKTFQYSIKNKSLRWDQYYDQAHYIRDFKTFTGFTPKSFLDMYIK